MLKHAFVGLIAFVLLTGFANPSSAQIILPPGEGDFFVLPLILLDVPIQKGDYCGNPARPETLQKKLVFNGNRNFLNILWNARDPGGIETRIQVTCYLNCPDPGLDIDANCAGKQSCTYIGPTGEHSCAIQNPQYNYKGSNNVVCKFTDETKTKTIFPYPNSTFYALDYSTSAVPTTVTIGTDVPVPVDVRSFSLLSTDFTINVTPLREEQLVVMDRNIFKTDTVVCGEVARSFPKIKFLVSTSEFPFSVLTNTSADPTTCNTDADCSYLGSGVCNQETKRCSQKTELKLSSGRASLPEYGSIGLLILIFSAAAIFSWRKF